MPDKVTPCTNVFCEKKKTRIGGKLMRNCHKELAQQEDIQRVSKELRQDERSKIAGPAQMFEYQEDRDQRYLVWKHQCSNCRKEENVTSRPIDTGQAIGYQRA